MTAPAALPVPTRANWLSIGALGVIWGGTFMAVRIALDGYGPLTVACARTTLGAITLLAAMAILRRPWPTWSVWRHLVPIGALNTALPFTLLSWGQQYVPSAFAGLSVAALPLFVLPLAHWFTDEKLTLRRLIGVVVGFIGAAVLIGPGIGFGGTTTLAQVACLAATLSYAISSILTRRCPPVDPIALATATLCVGAAILLPAMLIFEGVPAWTDPRSGVAILVLGLVPTALAAFLRVSVIRSAGSVFLTLVNYQVPLWSVLFGWAILHEDLPWRFFMALTIILAGVAISQWGSLRRLLAQHS